MSKDVHQSIIYNNKILKVIKQQIFWIFTICEEMLWSKKKKTTTFWRLFKMKKEYKNLYIIIKFVYTWKDWEEMRYRWFLFMTFGDLTFFKWWLNIYNQEKARHYLKIY